MKKIIINKEYYSKIEELEKLKRYLENSMTKQEIDEIIQERKQIFF